MSSELKPNPATDEPIVYQIRVKGHLGGQWEDWFGGVTIAVLDNGDTLLTGPIVDQAALYGLLKKVRDLGMPLNSVLPVEPTRADTPDVTVQSDERNKANLQDKKPQHETESTLSTPSCGQEIL